MIPNDEYLHVDQMFDTKRDLLEAVCWITVKHNFEFKLKKKSNKSTFTIICMDQNCSLAFASDEDQYE